MAITTYLDFVNNYLVKNGMLGNATNINKAPDQLKQEIDIINSSLTRADKYLSTLNIANMIYDTDGNLIKIRYSTNSDINYEVLAYTAGNLTSIQHYVTSTLKGATVLTYDSDGDLISETFTAV